MSMRSRSINRLYLQCAPEEELAGGTDSRIWDELAARFDFVPITARSSSAAYSDAELLFFVVEPMQYRRSSWRATAAHMSPLLCEGSELAVAAVRGSCSERWRSYARTKESDAPRCLTPILVSDAYGVRSDSGG